MILTRAFFEEIPGHEITRIRWAGLHDDGISSSRIHLEIHALDKDTEFLRPMFSVTFYRRLQPLAESLFQITTRALVPLITYPNNLDKHWIIETENLATYLLLKGVIRTTKKTSGDKFLFLQELRKLNPKSVTVVLRKPEYMLELYAIKEFKYLTSLKGQFHPTRQTSFYRWNYSKYYLERLAEGTDAYRK